MPLPRSHETFAASNRRPRIAVAARAAIERLEGRQLLSGITFTGGVLTLTGDSNRSNHLYVDVSGSQFLATANGHSLRISQSALKKVVVVGGPKSDRVWIHTKVNAPAVIQTFDGNDTISSGNGNDSITAGAGNDAISACGGNDTIVASDGQDTINGGAGNDLVTCGNGNNRVLGEDGNDTIVTGSGDDTLFGGAGDDSLSSGAGDDRIQADAGKDTLLAGDGDDILTGGGDTDILDGGTGANTYLDLSPIDWAPSGTIASTAPQLAADTSDPLVLGGVADLNSTVNGTNGGDAKAPTPVIQLIGATGVGPHTVFVHALDSTLGAGDPLTAKYQWDFGDANGRFNTLTGWNAAHIYDEPGDYTVTLTITNELGKSSVLGTTVSVTEDTRRTIYVDNKGSDTNNGLTPETAVKTADRAAALMGGGMRLMFHAGQTFNVDSTISLPFRDVLVGAYGTGAAPVMMRVAGVGTSIFGTFESSGNVVIQDLTMDSPWKAVKGVAAKMPADGVFAGGTEITVRRCTFLNLDNAVDGDRNPTGTLVQDCSAPLATGIRGYFIWGQGSDQVYLGNYAANSTREHIVRTVGTDRQLIAYNDFTNLDRSTVDNSDNNKGVVDVHRGSYAYVAQNEIHDGELRAGPRGGSADIPGSTTSWTVFEDNHTYGHEVQVYPGTQHLMVRNNVIANDNGACINIVPASDGRNIADIRILNNTGVNNSVGGQFLYVFAGAPNRSITVENNLWIAPKVVAGQHGTAAIYVAGSSLNEFALITHNVWQMPTVFDQYAQGGVMYMWPKWGVQRGFITPAKWNAFAQVGDDLFSKVTINSSDAPGLTSAAANFGLPVAGVFDDLYGDARPSAGWTVGAVQLALSITSGAKAHR